MKYQLIEDDVFEWNGNDYIVIDIYSYNNINYYFTNKLLDEDEPGKEFIVFKGLENGLIIENNKEILDSVLPIFSKNMNDRIKILRTNSKEGENNE